MWSPSARRAFFPSSTYWVYSSWILAVGMNAMVFPLNDEETFLIEFQLHQRKMSIKRLFSLFYFVLMNIVVFSHSTYSKPFEQR